MSEDRSVQDIMKQLAEPMLQDRLERKEQTGRRGRSRNDNTAMSSAEFGAGSAVEAEDWLAGVKLAKKVVAEEGCCIRVDGELSEGVRITEGDADETTYSVEVRGKQEDRTAY